MHFGTGAKVDLMPRQRLPALIKAIQSASWDVSREAAAARVKELAVRHHIGRRAVYKTIEDLKIELPISKRRWTDQQDIELKLLARIADGPLNVWDAAKKLNRSYQVVYEHACRLGLSRRTKPRWSADHERRLATLVKRKRLTVTLQRAAEVCRVSIQHIHAVLKRKGIQRRAYIRWTKAKDKILLRLHARGVFAETTVQELETTYTHLGRHEKRLGISFPRTRRARSTSS